MLERGRISATQAFLLLLSTILPTAILTVPAITVRAARQDAWLSVLLATFAGLGVSFLVTGLSLRFPGKTLIEYLGEILGKWPGRIAALLYIWWFFQMAAEVVREFGTFLVAAVMPETPLVVFHIVGVAVVMYLVRSGLEVLARFNQLFLPATALLAAVFLLSAKDMRLDRLLPLFDSGLVPVLKGAAAPASWLGEVAVFAMLIPYLDNPGKAPRAAAAAILGSGFFLLVSIFEALLIFGPETADAWVYPVFNAVRIVSLANFLERLESVVMAVWMLGGFVKVGVFCYAAVLGSAQLFGLKDYRPLALPAGAIVVALSILLNENTAELLSFLSLVWPPYALSIFEIGLPALFFAAALVRQKRGARR
ncbi:MAG: GerAB/ArcD/ProY family transporter [Desulfotomaculales bacterium]